MPTRRLILLIVVVAALLAACGGAPAQPSANSVTAAPAATAIAPTTSTAPTAAAAPTAGIVSTTPNDATQARLRVSQCVFNGPKVDVFVNGAVAVNGGLPQANMGALDVSGYLYLTPGAYSVAVVPTGTGLAQAILGPLDVPVAAGHRYTVVVLGQVGDAHYTPLVIDETAAYQAVGATPTGDAHITVNNIKGVQGIDFSEGGIVRDKNVPFGGFKAAIWPVGNFKDIAITGSGVSNQVIDRGADGFNIPGTDTLDCFGGHYPGTMLQNFNTLTSASTSALSAIEFLQDFSGKNIKVNGATWSFDTFLGAITTAGLTELFTTGEPYLLFPPTDDAFAALPKAQRDALLANPKALADLVRNHVVAGYYPYGSLSRTPGTPPDRTVTNLLGTKLVLLGRNDMLYINGDNVGGMGGGTGGGIFVANGIRIEPSTKVLLPGAK